MFGAARCRQQLGQFDEARALYEDFIAANPESTWLPQAESGLLFLKKAERAKNMPAPAAPVVTEAAPVVRKRLRKPGLRKLCPRGKIRVAEAVPAVAEAAPAAVEETVRWKSPAPAEEAMAAPAEEAAAPVAEKKKSPSKKKKAKKSKETAEPAAE